MASDVRFPCALVRPAVVCWILLTSPAFAQDCVGDCDANAEVSVAELVRCVNIGLGNVSVEDCLPCDTSGDGTVTVNELIRVVNSALFACPARPAPSLYPGRKFGGGGDSVQVADFNADGVPDLVTAHRYLSVLLGAGDGTFGTEHIYGTNQTGAGKVAVADLNADGVPDLVTANNHHSSPNGQASVLLGRGDGTFINEQRYDVGHRPQSVAVADLNADGAPDLLTANKGSNDVSVLLGRGDGSFNAEQRYFAGNGPGSVAVADLNRDGAPDLVTANGRPPYTVGVLLGVGDGTFNTHPHYRVGIEPDSVAVTDLNGDGVPDVVTANAGAGNVSVLLGVGDGTFTTEQRYSAGDVPLSVAVADLNGDGVPDLVTANERSLDVSVLLGVGDGTVAPERRYSAGSDGAGGNPQSVAVADLNADGVPDLVTANSDGCKFGFCQPGGMSVLLGVGDGTFRTNPTAQRYDGLGEVLAMADLNGDDVPDLVSRGEVRLGVGDGTFASPQGYDPGDFDCPADAVRCWGSTSSVAVADLNADGVADLVTGNSYGYVDLGDCGDLDLYLCLYLDPGAPRIVSDTFVSVLRGVGDGTFGTAHVYDDARGVALAVADLNADGLLDLATGGSVLLGVGDGTFGTAHAHYYDESVASVDVADLNGDDVPDLVAANAEAGDMSVLLGVGDGTFGPVQRHAAGGSSVAVADLNADGLLDLVTSGDGVWVLLGVGDGTFGTAQSYDASGESVAVADLNGDGVPDIVTGGVSLLLGVGDGTFHPEHRYAAGGKLLAVADLNGDGLLDLATSGDGVWILLALPRPVPNP